MAKDECCACSTAPTLIFACSGAADVGEVADRAARHMTREGHGKMYCLAGVGGRVNDMLVNTRAAGAILAIDGCDKDCARSTLEQAGFAAAAHVRLSDLGMQKGKSPATDDAIARVVVEGVNALAQAARP